MSSTVQLESKQKLPQKVTDVVCDISSMINNAVATSNSNDLMSSSFKAIVGSESLIENSSKLLESIGSMLTEMDSKFSRGGQLEHGVMMLSDAQEALQRLERVVYHDATGNKMQLNEADEEWRRRARDGWNESLAACHSDPDYQQMLRDRELLPENDEELMRKFDEEAKARKSSE